MSRSNQGGEAGLSRTRFSFLVSIRFPSRQRLETFLPPEPNPNPNRDCNLSPKQINDRKRPRAKPNRDTLSVMDEGRGRELGIFPSIPRFFFGCVCEGWKVVSFVVVKYYFQVVFLGGACGKLTRRQLVDTQASFCHILNVRRLIMSRCVDSSHVVVFPFFLNH